MPPLTFNTPSFEDGEPVSKRFTCDGADASPPLSIGGVPSDAAALVVTVDDPVAPNDSLVHWLL